MSKSAVMLRILWDHTENSTNRSCRTSFAAALLE